MVVDESNSYWYLRRRHPVPIGQYKSIDCEDGFTTRRGPSTHTTKIHGKKLKNEKDDEILDILKESVETLKKIKKINEGMNELRDLREKVKQKEEKNAQRIKEKEVLNKLKTKMDTCKSELRLKNSELDSLRLEADNLNSKNIDSQKAEFMIEKRDLVGKVREKSKEIEKLQFSLRDLEFQFNVGCSQLKSANDTNKLL
ncbi:hypothetical protein BpHYR1_000911 [Brachionus plicatilis]|uniref:Uncharacterized protein n=1 Tax=Brachionus plicatilis TaxID=10195 RepID=A0A3M7T4Q3_BRAPC|nr:hypothetical protein BpHYR1_000911 [Brachionus plicatilis]